MMKKFLLIWGIMLLLVMFQTSLLAPWFADYLYPDLLLVLVVSAVAIFGFQGTWIWIIIAGATLDLFAYSRMGTHVIIFSLAAYAISFISRRFSIGDKGVGIALVVLLMPAISALDFFGVPFLNGIDLGGKLITPKALLSISVISLENVVLFFIFYPILLRLKKYYSPLQYRMSK